MLFCVVHIILKSHANTCCLLSTDVYHVTFDTPTDIEVFKRLKMPPGCDEKSLVARLVVYHRHVEGIVECYKKISTNINADQPKADVFSQGTYVRRPISPKPTSFRRVRTYNSRSAQS